MLYPDTPTADFYFLASLRESLLPFRALQRLSAQRFIRRIGPNCFIGNHRAVIIRYATARELKCIERLAPVHCAYVIDDDFPSLEHDTSLPADYRQRLVHFHQHTWPRIMDLCDWVVTPNPVILKAYKNKKRRLLQPACVNPPANLEHHFDTDGGHHFNGRLSIVYSGTRSHLADLEAIAPMLNAFCNRHPEVTLTTFLGRHAPESLRAPNITHRKPLSWRAYKRMQRSTRHHLALAPMRNTPFNRARSLSRVLDHAAFGAASLYPDLPIFRQQVQDGKDGLLLPAKPDAWEAALEKLVGDNERLRQLATGNALLARRIGNVQRQRDWWLQWFGMKEQDA